jgi:hypothetical protein
MQIAINHEKFQDDVANDSNTTEQLDDSFEHKRANQEDHIQTYSSNGKRLRIISEASLATALNEEDEIEEEMPPIRVSKRHANDSHNLQPKVESLEFLDESTQHVVQQTTKQPQNITYMNMDSFTEKTNTVVNQQVQGTVTRKFKRSFWLFKV